MKKDKIKEKLKNTLRIEQSEEQTCKQVGDQEKNDEWKVTTPSGGTSKSFFFLNVLDLASLQLCLE